MGNRSSKDELEGHTFKYVKTERKAMFFPGYQRVEDDGHSGMPTLQDFKWVAEADDRALVYSNHGYFKITKLSVGEWNLD